MIVIAIDGPGGSGKSTVAKAVASRLGIRRLDTGAMYRAVTWMVLSRALAGPAAADLEIEVGDRVIIDGEDVTEAIRTPTVTAQVSEVSADPEVRRRLVAVQRRWAEENGGGVIEGRDIGSAVFPNALVKVFLTASDEERARRRAGEGGHGDVASVAAQLARRDLLDSTRAASPLVRPDGSVEIDTTALGIDDVVEAVLALVRRAEENL